MILRFNHPQIARETFFIIHARKLDFHPSIQIDGFQNVNFVILHFIVKTSTPDVARIYTGWGLDRNVGACARPRHLLSNLSDSLGFYWLNFSYLQGQQVVNTDGDSQTVGREGVIYIGKWWNKKSRKKNTDPNLSPRTSPGSVLDICLTFRWND